MGPMNRIVSAKRARLVVFGALVDIISCCDRVWLLLKRGIEVDELLDVRCCCYVFVLGGGAKDQFLVGFMHYFIDASTILRVRS